MKATKQILEAIDRARVEGRLVERNAAGEIVGQIDEKHFQSAVEELAKRHGWLVYHTRDSRKSAAGFPDLVLVRGRRVIFAELKSAKGERSAPQRTWGEALEAVGGTVSYFCWRPADWPKIWEILTEKLLSA